MQAPNPADYKSSLHNLPCHHALCAGAAPRPGRFLNPRPRASSVFLPVFHLQVLGRALAAGKSIFVCPGGVQE